MKNSLHIPNSINYLMKFQEQKYGQNLFTQSSCCKHLQKKNIETGRFTWIFPRIYKQIASKIVPIPRSIFTCSSSDSPICSSRVAFHNVISHFFTLLFPKSSLFAKPFERSSIFTCPIILSSSSLVVYLSLYRSSSMISVHLFS